MPSSSIEFVMKFENILKEIIIFAEIPPHPQPRPQPQPQPQPQPNIVHQGGESRKIPQK